jgi:FkbM family methyltransferase
MSLSLYHRFLQSTLLRVRPSFVAAWLKTILRVKRVTIKTSQGIFWVDPVSVVGSIIMREGVYEKGMIQTLEKFLKPGSIFVDLGANEGYFSVIAARLCGSSGHVISIEPQNRLIPVIQENLRVNHSVNVTLINAAIGDKPGIAEIKLMPSVNTGGSGFGRRTNFRLPTQEITMMTLEQVLDAHELSQVHLLKVDIEGYEYEALLGSKRVFEQRRVKRLALELHPTILEDRGKDGNEIDAMLKHCGYRREDECFNEVWVAPKS